MDYSTALLQTAAQLCRLGIRVFPLAPAEKNPRHGFMWKQQASNRVEHLATNFPAGQMWNLGVVMGPSSGIMDLEPDDEESFQQLEQLISGTGVRTIAYRARRGVHYWFKYDDELNRWGTANPKVGKLEIRLGSDTKGCYSACPPSVHPESRQHYAWLPGCSPWEVAPAQLPESIKQWFLANVKRKVRSAVDVEPDEDGYLPGVGYRHAYLLRVSKTLYHYMRMPKSLVTDIMRTVSERVGTYSEEGRGETEVINLVAKLERANLPGSEFSDIDFHSVNELVTQLMDQQHRANAGGLPEIPSHIFPEVMQTASEHARLAQYPRNLWLMTSLAAASGLLGNSVRVRAGEGYPTTGIQIYSFGVGGSGTGKSKVMSSLLSKVSADSDLVLTDATPEALVSRMAFKPRGALLELTEGKDFFKMLGRYQQGGAGGDNSIFHKTWSGDRFIVARQRGQTTLNSPFLSVAAAIQRVNLAQIPSADLMDGLLQRMLVFPIGRVPPKPSQPSMLAYNAFMENTWSKVIKRLHEFKPTIGQPQIEQMIYAAMKTAPATNAGPLVLTLNDEARAVWEQYAATKRSPELELLWPEDHPFRSDVVRHAEYALRIAAVLTMIMSAAEDNIWVTYDVPNQSAGWIAKETTQAAIDLVEWCWFHKQIYMDGLVETAFARIDPLGTMQKTESIMDKLDQFVEGRRRRIERKGEEWTLRDYYRTLGIDKAKAEEELSLLLQHRKVIVAHEDIRNTKYRFVEASKQ